MDPATSTATVETLLDLITRFGRPAQIVSDNGVQFTSEEFRLFCAQMNIQHILTTP